MDLSIPVIVGTEREGRRSASVARYVHARLAERENVESPFIDPAELPLGNLERREWEFDEQPGWVRDLVQTIDRAAGFILVTPEYNHGYPGALKNLLDFVYDEWNRKPFGIVGCGGVSGGIRAIEQLYPVIVALQGVPVPRSLTVQWVGKAFDEGGEPTDPKLAERTEKFLDLVVEYAEKCRALRH